VGDAKELTAHPAGQSWGPMTLIYSIN